MDWEVGEIYIGWKSIFKFLDPLKKRHCALVSEERRGSRKKVPACVLLRWLRGESSVCRDTD